MSVTSAMYTGVSGLLSNSEAMSVIGNNISNVNTVGFKSGRTLFADMLSDSMGDFQVGTGTELQAVNNLFTQGSSQQTGNVTDLMVTGNSFFAVKGADATAQVAFQDEAYLTRAGAFHVDGTRTLVNPEGYQVLDTEGKPIRFDSDFGSITKISQDGLITYVAKDGLSEYYYSTSGAAGVEVTSANAATVQRIALVTAVDPTALQKEGGSLYKAVPGAGVAHAAFGLTANTPNGVTEKIISNSLESSNADMAKEFVSMILTQRAYSASSRTITTTDEMTQEVLGLIR